MCKEQVTIHCMGEFHTVHQNFRDEVLISTMTRRMARNCNNELNVTLSSVQLLVLEALRKTQKVFLFQVVPRQVEDIAGKQRRLGLGRLLKEMLPDRERVTLVNTEERFSVHSP